MPTPINVINFDTTLGNPSDPFADDYNAGDAGWFTPTYLGMPFYLKHYSTDESQFIGATGTGLFNPFLNMNGDSTLRGFNTDIDYSNSVISANALDISNPNTDALRLGDIPIVYRDLNGDGVVEAYYQINLDINENNATQVSLEQLQIYTSHAYATLPDYHFDASNPDTSLAFANNPGDAATDFVLRFNMRDTGTFLILRDDGAGQGKLDYAFYFPVAMFAGAAPTDFVTLFSQFGPTPPDDAGFAEWNTINAAKITGIKFNDHDNDGTRDNGDEGLGGFVVYIDQNNNNKLDAAEQYTLTASDGTFTFYSLLPNSSYTVREVLSSDDRGTGWTDGAWTALLPPNAGTWSQSTDPLNDGDQTVVVGAPGIYTVLVGNHQLTPDFSVVKSVTSIDDGADFGASFQLDSAGDVIHYTITIDNIGEVALTGFTYTDLNADGDVITYVSGDTHNIGTLDTDEVWTYSGAHTLTAQELASVGSDVNGALDTDGDIDNRVTVSFDQVGPRSSTVATPIVLVSSFTLDKEVVAVRDGPDGDTNVGVLDGAGDMVDYRITITNTGNTQLTLQSIIDQLEGQGIPFTAASFTESGLNNDLLDAGETWTVNWTETVSQSEFDALCAGDESLTNTVSVTFAPATGPTITHSDTVETPVACNPALNILKDVTSITGGVGANGLGGADSAGDKINYAISVQNTGNITLTGVTVTDPNADAGSITYLSGDSDSDGKLDVGETWLYSAVHTVTQAELDTRGGGDGDVDNIATADSNETDPDTDPA
ncbi:MAG: hypothetical protein ACKOQ3_02970, partial [Novosphingobium sp.]